MTDQPAIICTCPSGDGSLRYPCPAHINDCTESCESAMVVIKRNEDGQPAVWCDPEIADLVSALNVTGIATVASCSGHGQRPGTIALADGRELLVMASSEAARKIDHLWPGISGKPATAQEAVAYWRVTFRMYPENVDYCETFACGPERPTLDTLGITPRPVEIISAEPFYAAPVAAAPVEMSPEFTDTARAAIAWVLWHHQGGSSPIGQPLRFALGMGDHDPLPDWRIAEAKRYAELAGATTDDFHKGRVSTPAAPGVDRAELLRRIDQADVALGCAGLGEQDILRSELREARAAVATLIDASPKGGNEHFQERLAEIEGRPRAEPEVDEVEEVVASLGDDAAAMLDENPEDERALNMQRAADLLTAMQATSAEVKP